jgi:hypothetical protein
VGRPESRPRRMMPDGTTAIMPAKTDAGYALVPLSSDKRALEVGLALFTLFSP